MDAELNQRMIDLRQVDSQMRMFQVQQLPQAEREHKHACITRGEIEVLPADVRAFHGIGRMFVLENKKETLSRIDARIAATAVKQDELAKKIKLLKQAHDEGKLAVEEMLRAKAK